MIEALTTLEKIALEAISNSETLLDIDNQKTRFLGKQGELTALLKHVATLSADEKRTIGMQTNLVKERISLAIQERKDYLEKNELAKKLEQDSLDVTLPTQLYLAGHSHIISQTISHITTIFSRLGFSVKTGPEIETDWFNFEALNIPKDHPSRDMHDTFYISDQYLLRTHTSPVQIRTMKEQKPPIRILAPGKVYRCDADATHSPIFHQIEGLVVDSHITFADLKGTLEFFLKELFGKDKKVRFRPSYFPFTEPSTEVDVQCVHCNGTGCPSCKHNGWLEILGAGMVHENVFKHVNYDPKRVTGFAFGLGVDRIAMLLHGIPDIRLIYENDNRFLEQF